MSEKKYASTGQPSSLPFRQKMHLKLLVNYFHKIETDITMHRKIGANTCCSLH